MENAIKALLSFPDGRRLDVTDIFRLVQSGQNDLARKNLDALYDAALNIDASPEARADVEARLVVD